MKRTWTLLAILTIFAVVLIVTQKNKEAIPAGLPGDEISSPVPTLAYLFPGEEGVVTSILIESREGEISGCERQGETWAATTPYHAETVAGAVEAAASQVTALPIEKSLENLDPADVGLNSPVYTLTIGFTSGEFLVVLVGEKTPTEYSYYVRKDDGPVLVVSSYGLDALLGLLTAPPLVETPTPSPAPPTETPTATEPAPTSTVTKTP